MSSYVIYIVDDEQSVRDSVTFGLKKQYRITSFASAEAALQELSREVPDLVLLDIGLPGMSGLEALQRIKQAYPEVLVVMITAFEDIATVVAAMKAGAHDYVVKPLHLDSLKVTLGNALETIRLRKEIRGLQEQYLVENVPCFIGRSNSIQDVMQFVDKVAQSPDTPILIVGETGTGKELIASAIHYKSPNFRGPFIALNCASIPKDLVESELFGYEKGAFSGALASGKRGLIEEAANGTLFLDEVGDMSPAAQAKLLRFLEDGEYYRVGGSHKLNVCTRVVSATNKNLEEMIDRGLFRQDLYYRLAVVRVDVPSLNERPDDIIPIARHFLDAFSRKRGKTFTNLSAEAEAFLKTYQWKGNVRELKNMIERGTLVGSGPELTVEDFGVAVRSGSRGASAGTGIAGYPELPAAGIDLAALEAHYIQEAFARARGNERKAARLLNMTYYAYRYKRKKIS
jgi:DNA-binding NtrC family response regulator